MRFLTEFSQFEEDAVMSGRRDHDRRLLGFARRKRTESTDAERKLWWILRSRKLAGFKFRRQYPVEGYIVDFICLKHGLVIECDGGQHNDPATRQYDERRTQRLEELGLRVLRFWDPDVLKHPREVAEMIYNGLSCGQPSPQPSPGVPGEGETRRRPAGGGSV